MDGDVERTSTGVPKYGLALGDQFSWGEIPQRLVSSSA